MGRSGTCSPYCQGSPTLPKGANGSEVALFSQPDCDSLGHSVWLVPGQDQMDSVLDHVLALVHWGRKAVSLCLGVVGSLQTPMLELLRGTKQETYWAEGGGIGLCTV